MRGLKKITKGRAELLHLKGHGDDRGFLIALENGNNLPFEVKRVYYIYGTKKNVARGFHAHRNLQQMLIAVNGTNIQLLERCKTRLNEGDRVAFLPLSGGG